MADRSLVVHILGDDRSLTKAFKNSADNSNKFAKGFGTVAKGVGIAAVGIGGAIAVGLKKSIDSANEHAEALAQTQAVLKSTGQAAGVTAKQITGLADSIEKTTGMDDLAIQQGENLLATFTNIRNETGKGNDIFTQTTRIMADMSQALGQDTKSSAIQLGKALNDPVRGVTALQRVGVSFTQGQKDQIKALVDSGKTMDAQKLILRELNKEFGGSAKAAGQTLPGQLNILKARLDDVAQRIGEKLVPALTGIVDWVSQHWPQISKVIEKSFEAIDSAWQALKPTFQQIVAAAGRVVGYIRQHWPQIQKVMRQVADDIMLVWSKIGPTVIDVARNVANTVIPLIKSIATVIKGVAQVIDGLLHGRWAEVWDGLKNIVKGAVRGIVALVKGLVKEFLILGKALGMALVHGLTAALKGLAMLLGRLILFPINKIIDAINRIKVAGVDPIPHIGHLTLGGQPVVVHTTVNVDGQTVAQQTTRQRAGTPTTMAQRRGRQAGVPTSIGSWVTTG